jgi:hydroxyethylthiazole kinase-like uncharacterized protein yjeF
VTVVRVTTAAESASRDRAAMDAGIPSRALMQRAGAAAAAEIARLGTRALAQGVAIFAGPGNNGGDGWVVARALAAAGIEVGVQAVGEARTEDARAERALAEPLIRHEPPSRAGVVVDALLGTGSQGAPRDEIAGAIRRVNALRDAGATVVSLDVPSGLDAGTGDVTTAVRADVTLTFGTLKRGLLVRRELAGRIVVLDIGLDAGGGQDGAPALVTAAYVRSTVPPFAADAHKGSRKRLVIVGGQLGMTGATILAAESALRSGIGMVRLLVPAACLPIVQQALPAALAAPWPDTDDEMRRSVLDWAHALLVGPGLGDTPESRALTTRLLDGWRGPVLLDADALNIFRGEARSLGSLLGSRPALLTPHVAEFARLTGLEVDDVLARRFDVGSELARATGAAVLLKGVPTVITGVTGERLVSAAGTPALATAGSGDVLSGIAATLLAQLEDPLRAGACAAWVHGRAAEIAGDGRALRSVTLGDVVHALPRAWLLEEAPPRPPVLAELPAVGEAR